jgi:sigma54-dependent transcription regulator
LLFRLAKWSESFAISVISRRTLAQGARISSDLVHEEIQRLKHSWSDEDPPTANSTGESCLPNNRQLDLFDRLQRTRH